MHDLLIKNGLVVDGTGAKGVHADISINDGKIIQVGSVDGRYQRVIDADGMLITPGFVDIHTHYDGQVTWDPMLTPSTWHGVTTAVFGNCGVGFAPVDPAQREWLIGLMEGVEDIPGTALHEGIQWQWETFPEYLDYLEQHNYGLNIGTQVPHGAVRAYVMGERGAANEPADQQDIERMASIVKEGIEAGALGFSTSRTIAHRAIDGRNVPGTFAAEDELFGIGRSMPAGVFELAPAGVTGDDLALPDKEVTWMRRLSLETGRPVTFALVQYNADRDQWRQILTASAAAAAEGAQLHPQCHGRLVGGLLGLTARHPFERLPGFSELKGLSPASQAARLADPALRSNLVTQAQEKGIAHSSLVDFQRMFPMEDPPNYEPDAEDSIQAMANRSGVSPLAVMLDVMRKNQGRQLLLLGLFNYTDGNLDAAKAMLEHPRSVIGLSDGGAHCGAISDGSTPTFMLTHWARDRKRG
ncbi:MAG: amidohydrolase family protein, partial [Pseudomonadales bacterium]